MYVAGSDLNAIPSKIQMFKCSRFKGACKIPSKIALSQAQMQPSHNLSDFFDCQNETWPGNVVPKK